MPRFEAKLQPISVLKRLCDSIKEFVGTDVNLKCNKQGIRLQTIIDKKRIAFVDVELPASGFKEYRCDSQESLGINFATFTKVLNCTNDDDIVTIKVSDYMHVLYLVCEAPHNDRTLELRLVGNDSSQSSLPAWEYNARATIPSAEFSRIVRDFSLLAEYVSIGLSTEGIRFAIGHEAAEVHILLRSTDTVGRNPHNAEDGPSSQGAIVDVKQNAAIRVNLKFLVEFSKSSALSDTVELMLGSSKPLLVAYNFGQGSVKYYLIPM